MKKLLSILLILLMVFTLVGCNSKTVETPTIEDKQQIEETTIVGGYQEAEDKNLTPELIEMFEKAFEGLDGASYTPVMLEATQVVAGTNYKFKAEGTKTTNPIIQGTYYVYINKDLQGNISLLDIEVIEESEVKETETDTELKQDITKMKFWVVFYDQYDNELQREALKYGTIPEYKGWLPEGFDNWTYKKSGKQVTSFKAITGNTYYKAACHEVEHHSSGGSSPTPSSACSNTNDLYYFTYLNYDGWAGYTANYSLYRFNGSGFNDGISFTSGYISAIGSIEEEVWYHSSDQYTFVECTDPNHHAPYGHICPHSSTYLLHVYDSVCNTDVYQWNPTSSAYEFVETKVIDWTEFDPAVFSEKWVHTNDADHPGNGSQVECLDYSAHTVTCFVAGTQIQYDLLGHTKSIEDFKVGDQIVSYNVITNTYYLAKVGKVFVHDGFEKVTTLVDVTLANGSVITMTPNHPVLTKDGFRAVDNDKKPVLKEGQYVKTGDGWTKIKEINIYNCEPTVTYNLGIVDYDEIIDIDTYDTYVAGGMVVHNLY